MSNNSDRTPPSSNKELPKRKQVTIILIIALVAGLALGITFIINHFFLAKSAVEATPAEAPGVFRPTKAQWASLKVAPIKAMSFQTTVITDGNIAFNDDTTTQVFSPFSGRVTQLIAKAGDVVKQGDPLMAVEASEFVQGQSDLISALGAMNTARAQLLLTEANEKRQGELYAAKAGALKDSLQAKADLVAAKNNLQSAEILFSSAKNRLRILGKSDEEIHALMNGDHEKKMNPVAFVVAPISGTVTQRQVGLGQYISSASSGGAAPVYSIGNLSRVWLIANVREADAQLMKLGQKVEVTVPALSGRVYRASITWVSASIDPNTRRLPVRAEIMNPDGVLKPLMFASFSIVTGNEIMAPAAPQGAIVYEGQAVRVFVARKDDTVELRTVHIGRTKNDMVEITEGLVAGEKIVTSGAIFIDRAISTDKS